MKFLISVIDDMTGSGTPEEMKAIDEFNDQLRVGGHWIFACGLASPAAATVIDNRGGAAVIADGSFIDSKEQFSGFWIIEAPNEELALTLAAEGSRCCNRKVELRPLLG